MAFARCQLLSNPLCLFLRPCQTTIRQFTTSPIHQKVKGGDLGAHLPKHVIPKDAIIPEYPYGESLLFKQSNRGLYGTSFIQHGNNVSPRTKTKTRRTWHPNILSKSLYSIALKKKIKLRVSKKVLKTIDKEGGLDEYLLSSKEGRIKELGPLGWKLRCVLMGTKEVRTRMRADARALGLDRSVIWEKWGKPNAEVGGEVVEQTSV